MIKYYNGVKIVYVRILQWFKDLLKNIGHNAEVPYEGHTKDIEDNTLSNKHQQLSKAFN